MSGVSKTLLIFSAAFLSVMLFTTPVYATENDQQPQEQQLQEGEELQEQETAEEQPQETDEQEENRIADSEEGVYTLTILANANMRSEPTTDSKSVVIIPFGVDLSSGQRITNTSGETWYAISYSGMSGYISADVVDVEATYINDTEETEGIQEGEEAAAQEQQPEAVTAQANASPSDTKTTSQVAGAKTSGAASAGSSVLATTPETKSNTDKPVTRKVDFIFLIFLSVVIVGLVITFIIFGRLRHEYVRYRKQILKNSKERVLQED